ncbi:transmembrane protein CCDC163 isoform X1 [Dipodomys spectabilis]|uniref:transmembrane protein CCDC163 isoform X1 n=1 Tax=Dipodomys spectabilis TaxID=105255 RepID=UPI001C53CFDC|nr:transmembrane protein CCDC163 isoform X1 [Dipodomys spectabilis]
MVFPGLHFRYPHQGEQEHELSGSQTPATGYDMNWYEQIDTLLNATDGSMARIKQRLYSFGVSTTADNLAGTCISSHHLPFKAGAQVQQPWALKTSTTPERQRWTEAYSSSSLWDEITVLKSQIQSQAQVTETLQHTVQGLLEERELLMCKISALEASLKLLQEAPEGQALFLEQGLELKRELQGLRSQVLELAHAQMKTRPRTGKHSTTNSFQEELQTEPQLLWEQSEILWEELKLLRDQLCQHQELLREHMAAGHQVETSRWKISKTAPFLTCGSAAFRYMPRILSKRTYSFRTPKMLLSDCKDL